MSKKDLEELLRRLAYAAYKVARGRNNSHKANPAVNNLTFKLTDYRTSIQHAKLMRWERRYMAEVDARIAALKVTTEGARGIIV